MGRGLIAGVGAALVVAAASAGAASAFRTVTLTAGQVRWFLPSELRAHDRVDCTVAGGRIEASVPPARPGETVGEDRYGGAGRAALSLDVQPNGAVEARCGSATHEPIRRAVYPYVVGRNGLGLIRGPNTLARVRKLYGGGVARSAGGACRVGWPAIGLTASFAGRSCTSGSLLTGATVTGSRWSSLSGVRVGDPVARMVWQDQTAKLVSRVGGASTWLLGGVGSKHRSELVAECRGGVVRALLVERA
jgi:hypothetical protein